MKATTIGLSAAALLVSGCVVREIREIHHVRDNGTRAPGNTGDSGDTGASCDGDCAGGGAPGAMMADSQPPPPLVEEALDQPGEGYVWVDGNWHWDGNEWVWIPGTWTPPLEEGVVFIPPAYYTSGGSCLYVPGRWQHGSRVVSVRDHRTRKSHHGVPFKRRSVRDHRTNRERKDVGERPVRDHRGEKPVKQPDVDRAVESNRDFVIRVPPRRWRGQEPAADRSPPVRADDDRIQVDRPSEGVRTVDEGNHGGRDDRVIDGGDRPRGGMHDYVIVPPRRGRMSPDRRPTGSDVGRPAPPTVISPTRESPRMRGHWVRPVSPPTRSAPPVMVPPSRAPSTTWSSPPVRTMSPRPVSPPPRQGPPPRQAPPAAGQSRPASSPPASAPAGNPGSRTRQAPAPRGPRTMSGPRR